MPLPDENQKESPSAIRQHHLDRADYLNMFSTLTSLVSTLAYFVEQKYKKLPAVVQEVTLWFVASGIAGVLASIYYKVKASRMNVDSPQKIPSAGIEVKTPESPAPEKTQPEQGAANASMAKNWAADMQAKVSMPLEHSL